MTRPRARIFDAQRRRRVDAQQLALFASPAPQGGSDYTSSDFVGPLYINPDRRHVLRMREMRAVDARTGGAA